MLYLSTKTSLLGQVVEEEKLSEAGDLLSPRLSRGEAQAQGEMDKGRTKAILRMAEAIRHGTVNRGMRLQQVTRGIRKPLERRGPYTSMQDCVPGLLRTQLMSPVVVGKQDSRVAGRSSSCLCWVSSSEVQERSLREQSRAPSSAPGMDAQVGPSWCRYKVCEPGSPYHRQPCTCVVSCWASPGSPARSSGVTCWNWPS